MSHLLAVVGLAVVSFVSTSFDNFTLLLGFFADDEYPRRQVVGGYLVSVVLVVVAAYALANAVELAPDRYLGLLGVVPLALGVQGAVRLIRHAGPTAPAARQTRGKGFFPVLLVMAANSGDALSVFVSVFADTADRLEIPVLVTTAVMALLYAALARWLVTRSGVAAQIQRVSRVALPFLLIAIGLYILLNTGTDTLQ